MTEPIEPSLQLELQVEHLRRTIDNCEDIEMLRSLAFELLELQKQKSAIAHWATRRAAEAEVRYVRQKNTRDKALNGFISRS